MRKKTLNIYSYTTSKTNPGPGTYTDVHTMKLDGKYFVSKYKSQKCRIIAPARSKRFKKKVRGHGNPGPGQYSKRTIAFNSKGSYFLSKMKNSGCNFFNKSKRSCNTRVSSSPGPGSYRLPSDFGYYESTRPQKFKRIRI